MPPSPGSARPCPAPKSRAEACRAAQAVQVEPLPHDPRLPDLVKERRRSGPSFRKLPQDFDIPPNKRDLLRPRPSLDAALPLMSREFVGTRHFVQYARGSPGGVGRGSMALPQKGGRSGLRLPWQAFDAVILLGGRPGGHFGIASGDGLAPLLGEEPKSRLDFRSRCSPFPGRRSSDIPAMSRPLSSSTTRPPSPFVSDGGSCPCCG